MTLIDPIRGCKVVLDTNVLLLHVAGTVSPQMIPRWECTNSRFAVQDFSLLQQVLSESKGIVSTPNIITETSHFLEELSGEYRTLAFKTLSSVISDVDERYFRSFRALQHKASSTLGVADAVQLSLAESDSQICLLSVDGPLVAWAQGLKLKAINFEHVRFQGV